MKCLLCALSFLLLIGISFAETPTKISTYHQSLNGKGNLIRAGDISENITDPQSSSKEEDFAKKGIVVFNPAIITSTFILFLIVLIIPFAPGIVEHFRPKDSAPLTIDMDYVKNPSYFDKSARTILENALKDTSLLPGIQEIDLSKKETIEIAKSKKIPLTKRINHVLYVNGNLDSGKEVKFTKEVFVKGKTHLGAKNVLRAVVCDRDIILSRETRIIRWIRAEGNIETQEGCDLGIRASCEGKLKLAKGCKFKSLYGKPISTYIDNTEGVKRDFNEAKSSCDEKKIENVSWMIVKKHVSINHKFDSKNKDLMQKKSNFTAESEKKWVITPQNISIPSSARIERHFVARKNLILNPNCTILGSIKAYEDIVIENNVTIYGNIFAEGNIRIGENCILLSNVFSQGRISISTGTKIGKPKEIKSIIGKKGIELSENVIVYGYVLTEGSGDIL